MPLILSPEGAKGAILQAQESSEVVGDQGHKGGYRRFSTLGTGNVQLRDAPLPAFTVLAPQNQSPRCPRTGAQTPECGQTQA